MIFQKQMTTLLDGHSFCSATGNRTRVYGVRGRCPRPLDDSTLRAFLSKAGAKVLLFFDMTKYF